MRAAMLHRTVPATPERVWDLWTTRAGLESWYFPAYLRPTVHELDLRAGGRYRIVAPGLPFDVKGKFLDVHPPRLLRLSVTFTCHDDPTDYHREEQLTLRATPEGCEVALASSPLPDARTRNAVEGAWTIALNRLEAAIGTEPVG